jgi:ACS family D-galactonate transporter-like MFS transporter
MIVRRTILLVSTFSFVTLMMLFSFTSILLGLKNELELNNIQFGSLLSVFSISYAAVQIPSGILSDRFGGKIVACIGLFVMGFASLVFSLSALYETALLFRVLAGLGGGLILPATVRLLSEWFAGEELVKAMSVFGLGQGIGFLLTYTLGSVIVDLLGWRAGSLFSGIIVIGAAVLSWIFLKDVVMAETSTPSLRHGARVKIRSPRLMLLIMINFAALAVTSGILQFAPSFLENKFGFSIATTGLVVALFGVMTVLSPYLGGLASERIGSNNVIILSMLTCTLFPIVLGSSNSIITVIICAAFIGFGTMFYFPPTFAEVPRTAGEEHAGKIFGIFNTVSFGASAVSPIIYGYVLDKSGVVELAFGSLSILAIVGLVGAILLSRVA